MKTVSYYRKLPYRRPVDIRQDPGAEGVYYVARIEEMPWIEIHGKTREEALLRLDEIFDDCIESMLEAGDPIPEPELWPGRPVVAEPRSMELPLEPGPARPESHTLPQVANPEDVRPFTTISREMAVTAA